MQRFLKNVENVRHESIQQAHANSFTKSLGYLGTMWRVLTSNNANDELPSHYDEFTLP